MKDMDFYNKRILRRERINKLLMSVKEKHNGCSMFLQCIKKLKDHMRHVYLEAILEGKCYAKER